MSRQSIQMSECILIKSRKIPHHNKIQYFITRMFDKLNTL